ncbi:MAG: CDP-alcohol phosphatidyltransferase family protein [Deltaproteobacteria bacterium]|nr:CDP-alcohol phosphatidyltransferase family protein [Deltaproteobacteria bacterium]
MLYHTSSMAFLTVPNLLSLLRMVLSPVFVVVAVTGSLRVAFILFCVAALTDMIDGTIARLFKQKSSLGAFLDPMADKLLMASSFITLTVLGIIPFWITAVVFLRDLLIVTGVIVFKIKKIKVAYRPTLLSKATTFFQIMTLVSALTPYGRTLFSQEQVVLELLGRGLPFFMVVTLAFTLLTAIQYTRKGLQLLKTGVL